MSTFVAGNTVGGLWFALDGVPAAVLLLTGTVLLGMGLTDRLLGDDSGDGSDDLGEDDDDEFFEDEEGDAMGGLEDMDDFDDDDGMDDFEGGDEVDELESRIDELENEVASVSSTVNTVRSENEEISESVDEMEENVRKLLDIYEMVTRGVNPFVDDVSQDSMSEESFGLFEDDGEGERAETEEVDDEVMEADADSFFDEDFDEEEADEAADESEGSADEEFDFDEGQGSDDLENGDGKTFDELKEAYEEGDASWAGEGEPPSNDEPVGEAGEGSERTRDENRTEGNREGEPGAMGTGDEARKPYLRSIPNEFTADFLVMEWMEYLLDNADTREALRAIQYYRNIEWISAGVAEELRTVVTGFDNQEDIAADGGGSGYLTLEHHTTSLEYVGRLSDAVDADSLMSWPDGGDP